VRAWDKRQIWRVRVGARVERAVVTYAVAAKGCVFLTRSREDAKKTRKLNHEVHKDHEDVRAFECALARGTRALLALRAELPLPLWLSVLVILVYFVVQPSSSRLRVR
jgi:hypothetical protein